MKKYRSFFSLPSKSILAVQIMLIGMFFCVLSYSLTFGSDGILIGLIDGAMSLGLSGIICGHMIGKKDDFLTSRRALGLMLFGIIFVGMGILIGGLLARAFGNGTIFEKTYFLSCGVVVVYEYVVLAAVSRDKGFGSVLESLLQPALIVLSHSAVLYLFERSLFAEGFLMFALTSVVSILTAKVYYSRIEGVGKKIFGVGSLSLFRSLIASLILDKSEFLENDLKKISVKKDVEVRTLSFTNGKERCVMVAPLVHPGPFRNLGGAALPTTLAESLVDRGIVPLIFHTPTTHEEDPVSGEDCRRIISAVLDAAYSEGIANASKPASIKVGRVTVTVQIFGKTPLVVITRSPVPTEDLPKHVHDICIEKLAEYGYSDGVIVDAHNSMDATYEAFEKRDEEDLLAALKEALERATAETGELFAGFSQSRLDGFSRRDGIGEGGVMVLVTQVNGIKAAFVSLDGNNLLCGLRERIKEELSKLGYGISEVTTTDTHVVTGTAGGQGYHVLGKVVPEKALIEKIIQSVREAESKISKCRVEFSKYIVRDMSLLGQEGLRILWSITEESIHVAKRGLVWLLGVPIICATVLFWLL